MDGLCVRRISQVESGSGVCDGRVAAGCRGRLGVRHRHAASVGSSVRLGPPGPPTRTRESTSPKSTIRRYDDTSYPQAERSAVAPRAFTKPRPDHGVSIRIQWGSQGPGQDRTWCSQHKTRQQKEVRTWLGGETEASRKQKGKHNNTHPTRHLPCTHSLPSTRTRTVMDRPGRAALAGVIASLRSVSRGWNQGGERSQRGVDAG